MVLKIDKCVLKAAEKTVTSESGSFIPPVQFLPSPRKPRIHRHTYDPSVLVHKELGSQPTALYSSHSSISRKQRDNTRLNYHFCDCFVDIYSSFPSHKLGRLGNAVNKLEWQENVKNDTGVVN